jgi:hypothetical protein
VVDLLDALHTPASIKALGKAQFNLLTSTYQSYWRKAKENVSCFPGALSMATLKVAASDNDLASLEACLTRIPPVPGYSPCQWKQMVDVSERFNLNHGHIQVGCDGLSALHNIFTTSPITVDNQ